MIIALDGGAASGKTTLARELSHRFEISLLESGQLYRAITFRALKEGISVENSQALEKFVTPLSLEMREDQLEWRLVINGKLDNPHDLRGVVVSKKVSIVAKASFVRKRLLSLQRSCYSKKRNGYLIAEGRDIGTVVFPSADIKVFLKVSESVRAKRRQEDFKALGMSISAEQVGIIEAERDRIDQERKISPLQVPHDAIVMDTSEKTVLESFLELIRQINIKKHESNLVYQIIRSLKFVPNFYLNLRQAGVENIPQKGGFILASNHLSHLDPVMLGFTTSRTLSFIARSSLFQGSSLFAWLISALNAYPINRENPDRKTLTQIIQFLLGGHGVVYFPEGTRSRDGKLGPFKKGIGVLALRTGFPVIPACVSGTREAMPVGARGVQRGKVTVKFGPPVDFSGLYEKGFTLEGYEEAAARVRESVEKLQKVCF